MTAILKSLAVVLAAACTAFASIAWAGVPLPAGNYVIIYRGGPSHRVVSVAAAGARRTFTAALKTGAAELNFDIAVTEDGAVTGSAAQGAGEARTAVTGAVLMDGPNAGAQLDATAGGVMFTLYPEGGRSYDPHPTKSLVKGL